MKTDRIRNSLCVTALVVSMCLLTLPAAAWDKVGNFTTSGNLGVGTESPAYNMHIYKNTTSSVRFRLENNEGYFDFFTNEGGGGFALGGANRFYVTPTGKMGINTLSPVRRLHLKSGSSGNEAIRIENSEGYLDLQADNASMYIRLDDVLRMVLDSNGKLGLGTSTPTTLLDVNGEATVNILNIRGGSDLSELFEINCSDPAKVLPGMVTCIDSDSPGKLILSRESYSRTVAGVISGAGGLQTGMTMSQVGTAAHGEHPVALTGRVYCYVDATQHPVLPGDLLTTSDTPGHAMKVVDYTRAQGAVLGKAMSGLKEGKGLVLVLISLQ